MKKITITLFIIFSLCFISVISYAQKTVVNEVNENLGGTVNPAFSVFIENAENKMVLKAWKDLFEEHKGKVETSKKDVTISNAEFPLLSSTPVAVHSRVLSDKSGVKVIAAFNKEGQFVCTKFLPTETQVASKIMYDFAVGIKKAMVQEKLDDASKELEKLEDNDKSLINKKESLEKDIKSYADKKKKAQEKLEEVNKELDNMVVKDEKLLKNKASYEKDIVSYDEKTREAEANIRENLKQQTESKAKIESQTKVVHDLNTKLSLID